MARREQREEERTGGSKGAVRHRHPLWEEYQFVDGERFYANPFSSQLSLDFPESSGVALGGLLGDEMGLGQPHTLLTQPHLALWTAAVTTVYSYSDCVPVLSCRQDRDDDQLAAVQPPVRRAQ